MKRTFVLLLLCVAALSGVAAAQPEPGAASTRAVYLLPMAHGLEQFLANHLASSGAMQVVTDPRFAGAVMADAIGPAFEIRMTILFPPAEPAAAPAASVAEGEGSELVKALGKAPPAGGASSFGRGKGNVFLVDAQSRQVLWSTFEKMEGSGTEDLDRAASRIVARLSKDMLSRPPAPKRGPADTPAPPAVK